MLHKKEKNNRHTKAVCKNCKYWGVTEIEGICYKSRSAYWLEKTEPDFKCDGYEENQWD